MSTTVWTVSGMTCGHCVSAVTAEVRALPGVTDVAVELESGRLTVTAEPDLAEADLAAAVDEAGYTLVTA
jgi:copper chaperone